MLLIDALSAIRAEMDDNGVLLTHFGNHTIAAGVSTINVADLSRVNPGDYVLLGEPGALEGHRLISTSGVSGAGTAVMSTPTVNLLGAYTPIGAPMFMDSEYLDSLNKALAHYSSFRGLMKLLSGFAITAGQSAYNLPSDFITPDQESFDNAVGATSTLSTSGSYYALAYNQASRFTATGYGSSTNFGGSGWYGYAPIIGNPLDNPNGGQPFSDSITYTFIRSSTPQLIIQPTPTLSSQITFFYNAMHSMPTATVATTVPVDDERLPVLYAKYLRCMAMATGRTQLLQYEISGQKINHTKAPESYAKQAESALLEFEKIVRFAPIGVIG